MRMNTFSKYIQRCLPIFGVRSCAVHVELKLTCHLATEAQAFSLKTPELFFDLYSPPRRELRARERLEQILRFASKRVSNLY